MTSEQDPEDDSKEQRWRKSFPEMGTWTSTQDRVSVFLALSSHHCHLTVRSHGRSQIGSLVNVGKNNWKRKNNWIRRTIQDFLVELADPI